MAFGSKRPVAENIGTIADSSSAQATFQVSISEPIGTIAESQGIVGTIYDVSITESIGTIAETQAGPLTMAASITEGIGTIADSSSGPAVFNSSVTEGIGTLSDAQNTAGNTFNVAVTETMAINDQQSATGGGGGGVRRPDHQAVRRGKRPHHRGILHRERRRFEHAAGAALEARAQVILAPVVLPQIAAEPDRLHRLGIVGQPRQPLHRRLQEQQ